MNMKTQIQVTEYTELLKKSLNQVKENDRPILSISTNEIKSIQYIVFSISESFMKVLYKKKYENLQRQFLHYAINLC